jgi:hypothetical protein
MRKPFLVALTGLALAACSSDPKPPPIIDEPEECDIDAEVEKFPGYPYRFDTFKSDILADLQGSCVDGACHAAPNGIGGFNVFPASEALCPDVQTFKSFTAKVGDLGNLSGSIMLKNLNGQDPHTPAFAAADALTVEITAFVQAAADEANPPNEQDILFDENVFADTIQPILNDNNCAISGCHLAPNGQRGFNLNANPAAGSPQLDENFKTMTSAKYISQEEEDAEGTVLYDRMTDTHQPNTLSSTERGDLAAWIQAGLDKVDPGDPIVLCADEGDFNIAVFGAEIRPMLEGEIDYNDLDGGVVRTGCARGPCHGDPSFASAGKFYLKEGGTDEEMLDSFRCFVNPENPANSQLLLCPLNLSGCRSGQRHPGEDIFESVNDLNYQKLLSYIYAARSGASPLDFAFFVRKINPIFSDADACLEAGVACADGGCHELQNDGTADGGSNFPLIRDAFEDEELIFNFNSASNFVLFNFDDADQSSLVLYPTNEIADVDNNVLATGDEHPGGECFAIDSQFSLDIQKFAAGLRPDGQGFLRDFLVAGVFPANDVTDEVAPFNEDTVAPTIFDISGQSGQFNEGRWDGLFSAEAVVNLFDDQAFPGAQGGVNQLAYAVAYMINATGNPIDVVVTAASVESDLELFVDNQSSLGRDGNNASVTVTVLPFDEIKAPTRILLKVFQGEGDVNFDFTMNFEDDDGNLLTDATQELVFVLSGQNGGI